MAGSEPRFKEAAAPYSGLSCAGLSFCDGVARDSDGKQLAGKCEDAVPVLKSLSSDRVLLGVADGLGGYAQGFDNQSGGQIASTAAMDAALDFFDLAAVEPAPDAELLTNAVFKRLRHLAETRLAPSRLQGALGRHKLATTLALAVLDNRPFVTERKLQCYWIGDSRIYFLDAAGLHQLSRDDTVTGDDAFDSLFDPPPMSQFLAASMERNWRINLRETVLDCSGVVIVCTDGCYAGWPYPWKFEAALQNALDESESWPQWINAFRSRLEAVLSDDASMVVFPINLDNFEAFQKIRSKQNSVLSKCQRAENRLDVRDIWLSIYKPVYEAVPAGIPDRNPADSKKEYLEKAGSDPMAAYCSRIGASGNPVAVQSGSRTLPAQSGRFALLLAWLTGFACGIPFGQKMMAWLDFFWRWFKSLWQST